MRQTNTSGDTSLGSALYLNQSADRSKKEHKVLKKFGKFIISATNSINLTDANLIHQSYGASTVCMAAGEPIELPAEIKEAIVRSLIRTRGKLTNGKSSLVSNGAQDLL